MRILQVISHYVPAYRFGGPLRVAQGLSRALVRMGHTVTVCCTNLSDELHDLDCPTDTPVLLDGVRVFYERTLISRYWGFSPSLGRRVRAEISNADLVFVHAHYQYAGFVGAREARRQGRPFVVFPHNSLRRSGIAFKNSLAKRLYHLLVDRRNFRSAEFLAFNSPEEKRESLLSEQGLVVPNGISPSDFLNLPPRGWFRERYPGLRQRVMMLFVGRLDFEQKGLDLLIPAFARVHEQNPELHLVIVGPNERDGMNRTVQCADENGVSDAVTVTGMLEGNAKMGALQDADAFVLPSRFEGMSIAVLEALHFDLPVLISDRVGICQEIQEQHAGVVVRLSIPEVERGLRILADARKRDSLRGQGSELVKNKYTWDTIAADLIRRIKEMNLVECPELRFE